MERFFPLVNSTESNWNSFRFAVTDASSCILCISWTAQRRISLNLKSFLTLEISRWKYVNKKISSASFSRGRLHVPSKGNYCRTLAAFTNEMAINKFGTMSSNMGGFGLRQKGSFLCSTFCILLWNFLIKLSLLYICFSYFESASWKCKKFTNLWDYDQKFRQCNCNNKLDPNVKRPPCAWLILIPLPFFSGCLTPLDYFLHQRRGIGRLHFQIAQLCCSSNSSTRLHACPLIFITSQASQREQQIATNDLLCAITFVQQT